MSTTPDFEPRSIEELERIMSERERDCTEEGIEYDRMNPDVTDPEPTYY